MALTNAFYNAIQNGDVRSVRIMMKNSLLVDPTFAEFNAMEKAAASMKGLYDEYDGKEFNDDISTWNDEYMSKVMARVISNFSHERLDHLKEVVRYLRPVTNHIAPKTQEVTNTLPYSNSYQEEKRRCQERGDYLGAKIGIGAIAGAAVGGIIAGVTGAPVGGIIAGVVAGAVVGGGVTAAVVKHEE